DPIEIECYGPVARGLHWLIAGLAVIVVVLGWAMPEVPRETQSRDVLLTLHRTLGLTILLLMLFLIFWRLSHPVLPFPADFPRLEALAAYADHALLYVLFLVMPLSGYLNAAFAGHSVS